MKDKVYISILLVLIIFLSIISIINFKNFKNTEDFSTDSSIVENTVNDVIYDTEKNEKTEVVIKEEKIVNISTYKELLNYTNKDVTTILVLAQTGCHYCELFDPVISEISKEYQFEIAKIDFKQISKDEYKKIVNGEIMMPAKCSRNGEDSLLSTGFGTPSTLFIKNSKSYDCIRGYKSKEVFETELKKLNLIN